MNLDIAFSDHHLSKSTLEELGQVVAAIHSASSNSELCFWTFIRYVSLNHPSILGVNLETDLQKRCDSLLQQVVLPTVTLRPSPREEATNDSEEDG
jgi:hypothetical protein